jgi:hypothetical protein
MVGTRYSGFAVRSVAISLATTLALAMFSAGGLAHAACTDCAFFGTGAGTGSSGARNSAFGASALTSSNSGTDNTAIGYNALFANTTGGSNTATGGVALQHNTTGSSNTATGWDSLFSNTTGFDNTATGLATLNVNTSGVENTATGWYALLDNTTGNADTASGATALSSNTTGNNNTATGAGALGNSTTGNGNIAVGFNAGLNLVTGDNNIVIGNAGVAHESNTIRIGIQGTQTATYVAGIFGSKTTGGCEVVVEKTGRLGCVKSSARYKRDIHDMDAASGNLMKLRPVTFRYKDDPDGTRQYGLIAEEVARVYPELIVRDADGKVESVQYWMLTAMLLNEVQKQAREGEDKDARIAALQRHIVWQQDQIDALKKKDAQIDALAERMNALEHQARIARPEHLASAIR